MVFLRLYGLPLVTQNQKNIFFLHWPSSLHHSYSERVVWLLFWILEKYPPLSTPKDMLNGYNCNSLFFLLQYDFSKIWNDDVFNRKTKRILEMKRMKKRNISISWSRKYFPKFCQFCYKVRCRLQIYWIDVFMYLTFSLWCYHISISLSSSLRIIISLY